MNKEAINKINRIQKTLFALREYRRYSNSATLSGWLVYKPHSFETKDGDNKWVSFTIFQIHQRDLKVIQCMTLSKTVIDKLNELTHISLITCLGQLVVKGNGKMIVKVEEILITHKLLELEVEENEIY